MTRALLLVLLLGSAQAVAGVTTREYRSADGARVLEQERDVATPLEDVWAAFTTAEG